MYFILLLHDRKLCCNHGLFDFKISVCSICSISRFNFFYTFLRALKFHPLDSPKIFLLFLLEPSLSFINIIVRTARQCQAYFLNSKNQNRTPTKLFSDRFFSKPSNSKAHRNTLMGSPSGGLNDARKK